MSGFFAFRRAHLPAANKLAPIGYKIGLEIAVKMPAKRIAEVPIFFRGTRHWNCAVANKTHTRLPLVENENVQTVLANKTHTRLAN